MSSNLSTSFPSASPSQFTSDFTSALRERVRAGELPAPLYAAVGLVSAAGESARQAPQRARELPAATWSSVRRQYAALALRGERELAEWQAQRILNERVQRYTPAAARVTVSARQAARRAATNPTVVDLRAASRKAGDRFRAGLQMPGAGAVGEAGLPG